MPVTIKVRHLKQCQKLLPCFSDGLKGGRVLLRENQCQLPAGHDGPHRDAFGGSLENWEGNYRLSEQGRI